VSKPSAGQKRSNEYVEAAAQDATERKRMKTVAATKSDQRAKAGAKTSQVVSRIALKGSMYLPIVCLTVQLKPGFADLKDVESQKKLYKTGRHSIEIVNELVIECVALSTGKTRWRCSSPGCQQSWASRQPQCLLAHSMEECRFIDPVLRERASDAASAVSPGAKVEELDAAKDSQEPRPTGSASQPSVSSTVSTEGRKATQTRFDFNLVNFLCAAQLAPSKIDIPEFDILVSQANINLLAKHSSYVASAQIPMESARIRRLSVKDLKGRRNLTISFDGGTAVRPLSFTTIHITTLDTQQVHLMEGIEASGISHTAKYYFEELEKAGMLRVICVSILTSLQVIKEIGPLLFSGISCDSTGNTRLARQLIHNAHPTIIMLPDPCHQLHNAIKDICRLDYFKEVCIYSTDMTVIYLWCFSARRRCRGSPGSSQSRQLRLPTSRQHVSRWEFDEA
jgi:hypothetical protein